MARKHPKRGIHAGFQNYERWYKYYSSKGAMRDKKMSFEQYKELWDEAKIAQSYQQTEKDRRDYMRNFSQIAARKQREASQIQYRVTWQRVKDILNDLKQKSREEMTEDELIFYNKYSDLTFKQYKFDIADVLEKAKQTYTDTEEKTWREMWDEAFALAFDSPKEEASA